MEVNTWKIEDFRNKSLDHNITSSAFEDTKKNLLSLRHYKG